MGRKNVIPTYPLVTNASLAASFFSNPVRLQFEDNICLECSWTTSDIVGKLTVQGSLTGNAYSDLKDCNGDPIEFSINSANDTGLFDLNQLSFNFVRLSFTKTSGTAGTLNVSAGGKQV